MTAPSNNPPDVIVYLTAEQAQFIIENADTNIAFALGTLRTVSRETQEKLVEQIENFRGVRDAVRKATDL